LLAAVNFQTMDNLKTRARIAAKTDTKNNLERLWEGIDNLNDEQKFSRDAYLEVKERIGSKILECEKTIREAESLLSA
jgi:hypothetical protein